MEYTQTLYHFLKEYETYESEVLVPTLSAIRSYLEEWESPDYWDKYISGKGVATPSPIRMIVSRIKKPEKVVDKVFRRPDLFPGQLSPESLKGMRDTIGIRIVVYFSSQLSLIDRELRSSGFLELCEDIPPKAYMEEATLNKLGLSHIQSKYKESGYSSIHYAVRPTKAHSETGERPLFEIQVRTLAQEVWGELEHVLSYKPETRPHFSAKRRFQILSREIQVLDEHFSLLYEELIYNQETASYQDGDTLTFENAPIVLSDLGIKCALTDLNSILKTLFSREITSVYDLHNVATPRRLVTIRNTFMSLVGTPPSSVEVIAILATLKGVTSAEAEIQSIKAQIEVLQKKQES